MSYNCLQPIDPAYPDPSAELSYLQVGQQSGVPALLHLSSIYLVVLNKDEAEIVPLYVFLATMSKA